jgi:uncharacterized membrane protein
MRGIIRPSSRVLLLGLALAGCSGGGGMQAETAPGPLRNATYVGVLQEPVTLADGRYEGRPFEPGAASRPTVTLVRDIEATGDLTGDGNDEAVVLLAHDAGGSGVFMYLAVMSDPAGSPRNIATFSLGDRARVTAIDVVDGGIAAELLEHGPDDPMCCPTKVVHREWRLPHGSRFSGHLAWGHESRTFTACGGEREGWVINEAGRELVDVYNELTTAPYQPMFVEVRGEWVAAPVEGFGADYDEALRITELLRAETEGFGCRLELDGVLFVVSGNEPSWRLQIREDGISMRSMGAPEEVVFAAPEKHGKPPLITFESSGADSRIRVTLEQRRCVDSMSGARFAWAATVDIDGRQLTGCAAEGL